MMLDESSARTSPRPGIGGTAGRPPVLITTSGAVRRRSPPALSATRTVRRSTKLASPNTRSTFGVPRGERSLRGTPNVDLVFGEASFVDRRTVRVALSAGGERLLTAPEVVINTGGRPAVPPIPGLGDVRALDSSSIMELGTVPDHLVVLGGGYVGLEFSQMFRRYGSRVTAVQRGAQLLPREDADIAEN